MKDFDSLIFDLDGKLWDTCEACAVAWNNVVNRNKIKLIQSRYKLFSDAFVSRVSEHRFAEWE